MLIYLTPPYCYAVTVVYTTNHIICQGQDDQNTARWPSRSLAHTNETNANSSLLGIRGSVQYHDQSNNISPSNAGYVALLVLVTLVMSVTLLFIFYLSTTIQSDTNRDGDSRLSTVRSPTLLNYKLRALKRKQSLEEELAPVLQLKKDDIIVPLAEPRPKESSEL
ncbi:hypothetical protein BgiMline_014073 [Biomphalaria glabrata]|uniref:Uncharacterized protein n=1 Tax=Biomphalaria glabrata TaxID=6526 RepID=A0A2C9KZS1_BIOGL|nr:hypothetical protein BgiMline_012868 [Biomphalaria glabrata]KAI8774246.1 hypothetical protein BgiBS90_025431 [Biomphalaria glabrata]